MAYELSKVKTLKIVTVKGWKSHREELDHKYTSGAFSEPAMYSFDIRTETKCHDLGSYLRMNFMRFQGGYSPSDTPYDAMGHPFLFYVDEQLYSWPELQMFDWERIAYIKCFENDLGDDPFTKWKTGVGGFTLVKDTGKPLGIPVQPPLYYRHLSTERPGLSNNAWRVKKAVRKGIFEYCKIPI